MNFEKIQKDFFKQIEKMTIEELEQISRDLHILLERDDELLYIDDNHQTVLADYLDAAELVISRTLLTRLMEQRKRG